LGETECKTSLLKKYKANYLCTLSILCLKDTCTINFLTFADYKNGEVESDFTYRKVVDNSLDSLKNEIENFISMVAHKPRHIAKQITFWSGLGLSLLAGALVGIHYIDMDSSPHRQKRLNTVPAACIVGGIGLSSMVVSFVF
jgi:hypothetical protein